MKITGWIVVPLLCAAFLGKYAERSLGNQIWFFVTVLAAFICTCYGIYREINVYKQEVEQPTDNTLTHQSKDNLEINNGN
jgi:hypothetical protein